MKGGFGHVKIGDKVKDKDGTTGVVTELADSGRWCRVKTNKRHFWQMVRNCKRVN